MATPTNLILLVSLATQMGEAVLGGLRGGSPSSGLEEIRLTDMEDDMLLSAELVGKTLIVEIPGGKILRVAVREEKMFDEYRRHFLVIDKSHGSSFDHLRVVAPFQCLEDGPCWCVDVDSTEMREISAGEIDGVYWRGEELVHAAKLIHDHLPKSCAEMQVEDLSTVRCNGLHSKPEEFVLAPLNFMVGKLPYYQARGFITKNAQDKASYCGLARDFSGKPLQDLDIILSQYDRVILFGSCPWLKLKDESTWILSEVLLCVERPDGSDAGKKQCALKSKVYTVALKHVFHSSKKYHLVYGQEPLNDYPAVDELAIGHRRQNDMKKYTCDVPQVYSPPLLPWERAPVELLPPHHDADRWLFTQALSSGETPNSARGSTTEPDEFDLTIFEPQPKRPRKT